tara:strand:- start:9609 stop:9797 length:189 start_codon:yes stop_codon:yes gene_type:complete
MDDIIKEWKEKKDMIVAQMRMTFEKESSFSGLSFESYCQMMAFRFSMLLVKDPTMWNFDLEE